MRSSEKPWVWLKEMKNLRIEGRRPAGHPKKTWSATIAADMRRLQLRETDAKWRETIVHQQKTFQPSGSGDWKQ